MLIEKFFIFYKIAENGIFNTTKTNAKSANEEKLA
jgi:hypothetical protein